MDRYILAPDGKTPVACENLLKWAKWYENAARRVVKQEHLEEGHIFISTVFLGMDHSWNFSRDKYVAPVLWETMIFRGLHDGYQDRYDSYESALKGHEYAVQLAKGEISDAKQDLHS